MRLSVAHALREMEGHVRGVSDGVRTRGPWDHNPVLYQLSYAHHDQLYRSDIQCTALRSRMLATSGKACP